MLRQRLVLMGVLAAAMMATGGLFGDDKPEMTKGKKGLPPLWSKLGLTDEQKQKVQAIQSNYSVKIAALQEQIKRMQSEERGLMATILTPAQRSHLKELAAEKAGVGDSTAESKSSSDDKKKDSKKDSDKK
jgi:Spy/CpxP family protein refolding chaperone